MHLLADELLAVADMPASRLLDQAAEIDRFCAAVDLETVSYTHLDVYKRQEQGLEPLRARIGDLRLREQAAELNAEQFAQQLREAGADETILRQEIGNARPAGLQAEITRLANAISELGAVNLAALEELDTASERKGYLDMQAADLTEAMETLENAIRRIDRETRDLLQNTFDAVNDHFCLLYTSRCV